MTAPPGFRRRAHGEGRNSYTAADVALRYAEDEEFAREFESTLASLYQAQLRRLERIAVRAGVAVKENQALPFASGPFTPAGARLSVAQVDLESLRQVLNARPEKGTGMTRGEIAKALSIDSREPALARALKTLKDNGELQVTGQRRSARYFTRGSAKAKKRG